MNVRQRLLASAVSSEPPSFAATGRAEGQRGPAAVHVKPAYSIAGFCNDFEVGRSFTYEEIAAGRLRAFKVGARTLIAGEDAIDWRDRYRRAAKEQRAA